MEKIAIFGGSFNPPGIHHRLVVEALVPHFDKIIVIPCGPRPDKETTNDIEPWHRAALTDIVFRDIAKVEVDLFDLELASFTPNHVFEKRYGHLGEIWHVIGSDLSHGGGKGESAIHAHWDNGEKMWNELNFCITAREGHEVPDDDIPPNNQLIRLPDNCPGTSSEIREHIFKRLPYADMVTPKVAAYIERYGLYRGRIPSSRTSWRNKDPQLLIYADKWNDRAMALAETYRKWEDTENPTSILVLGGDGTMLRAIREHWRLRLPFIGVNQGHLGFLLNEPEMLCAEKLPENDCVIRLMPMLYIETESPKGERKEALAFNDAWIERSTSQSAWVEVDVSGEIRIPKLVADGALVSTAAGSTAYARSMGVAPLLADSPGWILAGSNVMSPAAWKSALLDPEATVTIRSIGGEKRPLNGFVGGVPLGPVSVFHARQSRIATVELVFAAQRDMAEKIARLQFPTGEPLLP